MVKPNCTRDTIVLPDIKAFDSVSNFLTQVKCLELPWTKFRDVSWISDELAPCLTQLLPLVRIFWSHTRDELDTENIENACLSDHRCFKRTLEIKRLIIFICSCFQGLAVSWVHIEEEVGSQNFEKDTENTQINETHNQCDKIEDPYNKNKEENDVVTCNTVEILSDARKKKYVQDCLSLVIEILGCGIIFSNPLGNLVLDHTNNGLLFFEAIPLSDPKTQHDILITVEQLLKLPRNNETMEGLGKEWKTIRTEKRLSQVLESSPHAIENLMLLVEQVQEVNEVCHIVYSQCLVVLKLFLQIPENTNLKLITTFQSLPELLTGRLKHEIFSLHNYSSYIDMTYDCQNILLCLQALLEMACARKYFLQTGLIKEILQCFTHYFPFTETMTLFKGLSCFITLFHTFVTGSGEDQDSLTTRCSEMSSNTDLDTFFKTYLCCLRNDSIFPLSVIQAAQELVTLLCIKSTAFLWDFLEFEGVESDKLSFHTLVALLLSPTLSMSSRLYLLPVVQSILNHSPAISLHAVSVGWVIDTCSDKLPFGLLIEKAFEEVLNCDKHPTQEDITINKLAWLTDEGNDEVSNFETIRNDTVRTVHFKAWIAGNLMISLLDSCSIVAEKILEVKISREDKSERTSFIELLTDVLSYSLETILRKDFKTEESHNFTLHMSSITTIIILLQVFLVWCHQTSLASKKSLEDATFVPFILDCLQDGNQLSKTCGSQWFCIIRSLAVAVIVTMFRNTQYCGDLLIVLQRSFTLKKLAKDFLCLFEIHDLPVFGEHSNETKDQLACLRTSCCGNMSLIHPCLSERLEKMRYVIEARLVQAYLKVVGQSSNVDPTVVEINGVTSKEKIALTETNYISQCEDEEGSTGLVLTEVRNLRKRIEFFLKDQQTQARNMENMRRYYESKVTLLENQLKGVLKAYEILWDSIQTDARQCTQKVINDTSSVLIPKSLQSPHSTTDEQLEALLELLGLLAKTFPDVKYFLDHFDTEHTVNENMT